MRKKRSASGEEKLTERTESILKIYSLTLRPLRMITGLEMHTDESQNQTQ